MGAGTVCSVCFCARALWTIHASTKIISTTWYAIERRTNEREKLHIHYADASAKAELRFRNRYTNLYMHTGIVLQSNLIDSNYKSLFQALVCLKWDVRERERDVYTLSHRINYCPLCMSCWCIHMIAGREDRFVWPQENIHSTYAKIEWDAKTKHPTKYANEANKLRSPEATRHITVLRIAKWKKKHPSVCSRDRLFCLH